jgi:AcrR family transcriptional regulator
MILSTALLVRERGARATSIDDVLAHSGAPRGSVYHHFPGGREQLLREATEFAGSYVAGRIEQALGGGGPLDAVEQLFDEYASILEETEHRAGCPIVAVAVEAPDDGLDLRETAAAVFDRWREIMRSALVLGGIERRRADELALYVISSFEGALILSRAYGDSAPLEAARAEVNSRVDAELTEVGER